MPEHTLFLIWMLGAPLCSSVRGYLEDLGHKALNTKPKQKYSLRQMKETNK